MFIKVRDKNGNVIAELGSHPAIRVATDSGLSIDAESNSRIKLSCTESRIIPIGEEVYEKIISTPYIASINSVEAAEDGEFFLNGSACFDWTYRKNTKLLPVLHINDLCSTVTGCGDLAKLKKLIEFFKLTYTAIKDVNLITAAQQDAHQQYLQNLRIPIAPSCSEEIKDIPGKYSYDEISGMFQLYNTRLLGQYMTVVHMWNYAVDTGNRVDKVTDIPDNDYGLGIVTRGYIPTCDGNTDISCSIEISQISGQEGLSLYTPDISYTFSPGETDNGGPMTVTYSYESATSMTIKFNRKEGGAKGKVIGAWDITAKWIPFFYAGLKDVDNNEFKYTEYRPCELKKEKIEVPEGGEYVTYGNMKIAQFSTAIVNPTKAQYLNSQVYFSTPSTKTNTWKIRVTWELSGTLEKTSTETYYKETPGVREIALNDMLDELVLYNPPA